MKTNFDEFLLPLKETLSTLNDYVDFPKIIDNVDAISIKLNQLNYLIGQQDMSKAVKQLWKENSKVFSVLDILIAVRAKDKKKAINKDGQVLLVNDFFKTPEQVIEFLNSTGLTPIFQSKQIKNLVDYVFGVEVGLDTNARKNRGGHVMEHKIQEIFTQNKIPFRSEVYSTEYPAIVKALGSDKKRFDFVVKTTKKTYLMEVNFYSGGGSKLNEVARAYTELAPKINDVPGFEFVWITDGTGWNSAKNKLEEAYHHIPKVYNLTTITDLIAILRNEM